MGKFLFRHPRIIMAVAALFLSGAVVADDATGWDWRLTPLYYWSINMGGNQSSGSENPPVDTNDYEFKFEGAFSADFGGVYDNRWGFVADLIWVDMSNTNKARDSKMEFSYLQAELDGFYRIPIGRQSVDWLVGLRYYDTDFELTPSSIGGEKDWVDPIVGARWGWSMSERWSLVVRGDVGGFGIGSDLSWQVYALADWQPWQHVSFTGGLRALGIDYRAGEESNLFAYDITVWGPLAGVSIKW
jgi:hypothetical protein